MSTVYDESLLNTLQKEKLAKLREYREKGILTSRDFEKKTKELYEQAKQNTSSSGVSATPTATTSVSSASSTVASKPVVKETTPVTKPSTTSTTSTTTTSAPPPKQQASSVDLSKYQLSVQDKEDIAKLEKFFQSGILTKDEFEEKRSKILANAPPASTTPPVKSTIEAKPKSLEVNLTADQKEQLSKLQKFVDMGVLTQDEFEQKKKMVIGTSSEPSTQQTTTKSAEPVLTADQKEQLAKLQKFVDMGILTQEEFDKKKQIVLETANNTAPSNITTTTSSVPVQKKGLAVELNDKPVEAQTKTSTQIVVHITSIKATSDQPFELVLNNQFTMYKATEDIPETKEVAVKGDIPHWSNEELSVTVTIRMPAIGVNVDREFNLTRDGRFIQIGIDNKEKQLRVKQQSNEKFDPLNSTVSTSPAAFRAEGKTDIYVKFHALKASADQPFEIYYMDKLIYSLTDDMPPRQVGVVNGQLLKERRCNRQEDEDHEVVLKIVAGKLGIVEATAIVNLTKDGPKLSVEVLDDNLVVKQSVSDESFESDFKFVNLLIKKVATSELNEKDFDLLAKLKQLYDSGVLNEEEYNDKKNAILNK
jgi:hypothetical protein